MNYINRLVKFLAFASVCLSFSLYAAQEYKGKVITLSDETYAVTTNGYDRGFVNYSARLGQILKPTVFDADGKVVVPGSIMINANGSSWVPYYEAAKIQADATKKILDIGIEAFNMYKELAAKNAASLEAFSNARYDLAGAYGQYYNADENLLQTKLMAERFLIRAPYEGIVTDVTHLPGIDIGGQGVIEVVQLNPIGISVDMPAEKQLEITPSTPIKVYVKGINEPLGGSHVYSLPSSGAFIVVADNYPVLENNTILKDNGTPVLREWEAVTNFNFTSASSKSLGVPLTAIQNDDKGSYVWKAKGQKVMQLDKGIDYTFPIEKVYIVPGDTVRYQSNTSKLVSLSDSGSLAKYDLVLNNPPSGLKDGETVVYPQQAYLMMPGDEVKVVIGDGPVDNQK